MKSVSRSDLLIITLGSPASYPIVVPRRRSGDIYRWCRTLLREATTAYQSDRRFILDTGSLLYRDCHLVRGHYLVHLKLERYSRAARY
jgi:hypothetical protein